MKKNYFLLILFCLFIKNTVEYKYDGPDTTSFWQKWTTVINANTQFLDNDIDRSLINFKQSSNTNLDIDYKNKITYTTNNTINFTTHNYNNYFSSITIPYCNQQPQTISYQVQYICNNDNVSYTNNGLANNSIHVGKGPSDIGITNDLAAAKHFSSNTWGNNDVATTSDPGGPGSGGGSDPFGGGIPLDTPIDGGLSLLMAVAIGKGIKSLRENKHNEKSE